MENEKLTIKIPVKKTYITVPSDIERLQKMLDEGKIKRQEYDANLAFMIDNDIAEYFKEDSVSEKSKRSSNQSGDSLKKLKKGGNNIDEFNDFLTKVEEEARRKQEEQRRRKLLEMWVEMQRKEEEQQRRAKEAELRAKASIYPQGGKRRKRGNL